jgi:hypothetical protein
LLSSTSHALRISGDNLASVRAIRCIGYAESIEGESMIDGIKDVVARLERQKVAIDKALAALRGIDAVDGHKPGVEVTEAAPSRGPKRKGGMTPEGRKRLSGALRKRWAAKRVAEGATGATLAEAPATRKRAFSAATRKRLAEAMKKRWAVKRAGSAVKKSGRRKRAAKEAAG